MRYSCALIALLAAAGSAAASQRIKDLPECATKYCAVASTTGGVCSLTDKACVCKNLAAVQEAVTSCVIDNCGNAVFMGMYIFLDPEHCSSF